MAITLGLDLTTSPARPSAYAILDENRLTAKGFADGDDDILQVVAGARPALVGIDAPLSLPFGLHCLDKNHPCQPQSPHKGRLCERELAGRGIGLFRTTKGCIIEKMVYRGIELKKALEGRGHRVLEVYPYATKVVLWGRAGVRAWGIPKKTTPQGLDFLRECLGRLIPGLEGVALTHDLCDAVLAAYTGYLYARGWAELVGDPQEGQICIPAPGAKFIPPT